jgi:hypothetical protein
LVSSRRIRGGQKPHMRFSQTRDYGIKFLWHA